MVVSKSLYAFLVAWLILAATVGCATSPLPPAESTMSILRSYHEELESRVASGHLTRAQGRDLYYAKLKDVTPPLPDLEKLLAFRNQVETHVVSKLLTPEQAETQLAARETEMLTCWEEMAARYAQQQREIEQRQAEQERGLREQMMFEQNTGIMNLPRR